MARPDSEFNNLLADFAEDAQGVRALGVFILCSSKDDGSQVFVGTTDTSSPEQAKRLLAWAKQEIQKAIDAPASLTRPLSVSDKTGERTNDTGETKSEVRPPKSDAPEAPQVAIRFDPLEEAERFMRGHTSAGFIAAKLHRDGVQLENGARINDELRKRLGAVLPEIADSENAYREAVYKAIADKMPGR